MHHGVARPFEHEVHDFIIEASTPVRMQANDVGVRRKCISQLPCRAVVGSDSVEAGNHDRGSVNASNIVGKYLTHRVSCLRWVITVRQEGRETNCCDRGLDLLDPPRARLRRTEDQRRTQALLTLRPPLAHLLKWCPRQQQPASRQQTETAQQLRPFRLGLRSR